MNWDHLIFKLINQNLSNSVFDAFFPVVTDLHKMSWFPYIAIALFLGIFFKKYGRWTFYYLFMLLLTLGLNDWIGAQVKHAAQRPRPFQLQELQTVQRSPASPNSSFYSNHSSNNFAAAYQLSALFPQASFIFYTIAFLIAYSRVYNGVHFPSDVICGALAGLLFSIAIFYLFKLIKNKIQGLQK